MMFHMYNARRSDSRRSTNSNGNVDGEESISSLTASSVVASHREVVDLRSPPGGQQNHQQASTGNNGQLFDIYSINSEDGKVDDEPIDVVLEPASPVAATVPVLQLVNGPQVVDLVTPPDHQQPAPGALHAQVAEPALLGVQELVFVDLNRPPGLRQSAQGALHAQAAVPVGSSWWLVRPLVTVVLGLSRKPPVWKSPLPLLRMVDTSSRT